MRPIGRRFCVSVVRLALAWAASNAGAAPIDTLLAALAAEAAAPAERVRLFIEHDAVADVYYIDRLRPGRLRMLKNPRQGGPELVIVDGVQWARNGSTPWRRSPARNVDALLPAMPDVFRMGLTQAVEQAGAGGARTVTGAMAWTNGTHCDGKLLMRIDAVGLPSLLRFDGLCGGKPFNFRQAFSFVDTPVIDPPQ